MSSGNTTLEVPLTAGPTSGMELPDLSPRSTSLTSSNGCNSSQEPQETVSCIAQFDVQPKLGNHIKIQAIAASENASLHISASKTQHGLEWERGLCSLLPAWGLEPSVNEVVDVATQALHCRSLISSRSLLDKPFLEFQGTFTKVYSIISKDTSYLMRLSLPVDPAFKTLQNETGFEWMLMERASDSYPLEKVWRNLPWAAKIKLVEDVARILGQLFDVRADVIGSIYQMDMDSCKDKKDSSFSVSRIVSIPFLLEDHIHLDHIPRGPLASSRDWLHARLQLLLHNRTTVLANPSSRECAKEDSLRVLPVIHRLPRLLPAIFPTEQETFALHHGDLSDQNILVNHTGTIEAIVDWECTGTMPLFICCQLPSFLWSRERLDIPDTTEYDLNDVDTLYYEHLQDYELTKLRKVFIDFMEANNPAWAEEYHATSMRAEFESAVENCDGPFSMDDNEEWLDRVEGELLHRRGED